MPNNLMKVSKDFSSIRLITTLTPNTFTRKMIVISTIFDTVNNIGQTAMKQASELNSMCIDYNKGEWQAMQDHNDLQKAIAFHFGTVSSKHWNDCEEENEK